MYQTACLHFLIGGCGCFFSTKKAAAVAVNTGENWAAKGFGRHSNLNVMGCWKEPEGPVRRCGPCGHQRSRPASSKMATTFLAAPGGGAKHWHHVSVALLHEPGNHLPLSVGVKPRRALFSCASRLVSAISKSAAALRLPQARVMHKLCEHPPGSAMTTLDQR